jgi:uncharacterized RmlC-like cupin family protein
MRPFLLRLALISAGLAATGAPAQTQGATPDGVELAPAQQLAGGVARTTGGLAVHTVFQDPLARSVHVRRKASGEVELHAGINDVMFAHKGMVTLVLGGRIEGGKETAPGEWRGGRIIGGRNQILKAGDMMWIPAGVPHQMILKKGSSFTYTVVKTLK